MSSFLDGFKAILKRVTHLRPHELNVEGHNNDKTVNVLNGLSGAAIDALPEDAAISAIETAVKIHPNQLKGSPIPEALHQTVADAANAALAAKLTGTPVPPAPAGTVTP